MGLRDTILGEQRDAIRETAASYGASRIALFGSVARGEEGINSDCDFLVDFGPDVAVADLIGLEETLADMLEMPADVVAVGQLRERHRRMVVDAIVL